MQLGWHPVVRPQCGCDRRGVPCHAIPQPAYPPPEQRMAGSPRARCHLSVAGPTGRQGGLTGGTSGPWASRASLGGEGTAAPQPPLLHPPAPAPGCLRPEKGAAGWQGGDASATAGRMQPARCTHCTAGLVRTCNAGHGQPFLTASAQRQPSVSPLSAQQQGALPRPAAAPPRPPVSVSLAHNGLSGSTPPHAPGSCASCSVRLALLRRSRSCMVASMGDRKKMRRPVGRHRGPSANDSGLPNATPPRCLWCRGGWRARCFKFYGGLL